MEEHGNGEWRMNSKKQSAFSDQLLAFLRDTGMDFMIDASVACLEITRSERWKHYYFSFTVSALKILWFSFLADLFLWLANGIIAKFVHLTRKSEAR
jgi:hypothetical protein